MRSLVARVSFASVVAALTGCLTLVSFDGYDPSKPTPDAQILVGDASDPFTITLDPGALKLQLGTSSEKGTATLRLVRAAGFDGVVNVFPDSLPSGLHVSTVDIAGGQNEGKIEIRAEKALASQTVTLAAVSGRIRQTVQLVVEVAPRPGSIDPTFGESGLLAVYQTHEKGSPAEGTFEGTGRIRVLDHGAGGVSCTISTRQPDGGADPSFGNGGVVALPSGAWSFGGGADADLDVVSIPCLATADTSIRVQHRTDRGADLTEASLASSCEKLGPRPVVSLRRDPNVLFVASNEHDINDKKAVRVVRFPWPVVQNSIVGWLPAMDIGGMIPAPDGVIVAGVRSEGASPTHAIEIDRVASNGAVDPAFGGSFDPVPGSYVADWRVVPDGSDHAFVFGRVHANAADWSTDGDRARTAIARVRLSDGKLDTAWGSGAPGAPGVSVLSYPQAYTHALHVARDAEGRVMVLGSIDEDGVVSGWIARLSPDGKIDTQFAAPPLPFGSRFHTAGHVVQFNDVRFGPEGIVALGTEITTFQYRLFLMRFVP